jgi:antimicrobial peptide system SdpB family protein
MSDNFIHTLGNKVPFTNAYGLARSILALGTLLTLVLNPSAALFVSKNFTINHNFILAEWNMFYLLGFENLIYAKALAIVLLLLVISGYVPQVSGVLHWWVSYSFFNAAVIVDGGDQITSVITLLLIPVTLCDPRMNHWHEPKPGNSIRNFTGMLFLFLIQIQVCILYFNAGIAKFAVAEWADGTAMYYWISHNTFGSAGLLRRLMLPVIRNPLLVLLLTWSSILVELLLFAGIFLRQKQKMLLLRAGIIFHLLIFIFLGLGSFFFAMTGALILYLYPYYATVAIPFFHFKLSGYGRQRGYFGRTTI